MQTRPSWNMFHQPGSYFHGNTIQMEASYKPVVKLSTILICQCQHFFLEKSHFPNESSLQAAKMRYCSCKRENNSPNRYQYIRSKLHVCGMRLPTGKQYQFLPYVNCINHPPLEANLLNFFEPTAF